MCSVRDLQDTLPQIIPPQHPEKTINSILHAHRHMIDALQGSLRNPLRHILVPSLLVLNNVGVEDKKSLPAQTPTHHLAVVLDSWDLRRGRVICAYGAACHWNGSSLASFFLLLIPCSSSSLDRTLCRIQETYHAKEKREHEELTDPAMVLHTHNRRIQQLPADIIIINVQSFLPTSPSNRTHQNHPLPSYN